MHRYFAMAGAPLVPSRTSTTSCWFERKATSRGVPFGPARNGSASNLMRRKRKNNEDISISALRTREIQPTLGQTNLQQDLNDLLLSSSSSKVQRRFSDSDQYQKKKRNAEWSCVISMIVITTGSCRHWMRCWAGEQQRRTCRGCLSQRPFRRETVRSQGHRGMTPSQLIKHRHTHRQRAERGAE